MQLRNTFFIETRLTSTYQAGKRAQRCEGMEYHDHTLSEREPRGSGNILPEIEKDMYYSKLQSHRIIFEIQT